MEVKIREENNGIKEIILNQIESNDFEIEEDARFFLLRMLTLAEYKILDKYEAKASGLQRGSTKTSKSKKRKFIEQKARLPKASLTVSRYKELMNNTDKFISILLSNSDFKTITAESLYKTYVHSGICPLWPFC